MNNINKQQFMNVIVSENLPKINLQINVKLLIPM